MIKDFLIHTLRESADNIESGVCELPIEQQNELLALIAHQPMSKAQAYQFLKMSRSQFDYLVKNGQIPKGQKRVGFKELVWYKDDLEKVQL